MITVKNPNKVCINCMGEREDQSGVCPICGFNSSTYESKPFYLHSRSILNGKYLVGRVIGEGGFGITYVGWDLNLNIKLAIKEYYPNGFASRDNTQTTILPYSGDSADFFETGKDKFLSEAQKLAQFSNLPGIVSVKDFFLENNTAYIVMEFVEGITLKQYIKERGGKLPFDELASLMKPVLESLSVVHRENIIHRDISPDNIMVTKENTVKLIDFGAARDTLSDKSTGVVLKPGFSPEEQYRSSGNLGPWTDLYSICATVYQGLTGSVPPEALERLNNDTLVFPSALGIAIPQSAEQALIKGLSVHAQDRYPTLEEFMAHFYGALPQEAPVAAAQLPPVQSPPQNPNHQNRLFQTLWGTMQRRIISILVLIAVAAGGSFGVYKIFNNAETYAGQAATLLNQGKVKQAEDRYLAAFKFNPNNYSALVGYAKTLLAEKNPQSAYTYANKAVGVDKNRPGGYIQRGRAENLQGKFDKALADFNAAQSKSPNASEKYDLLVGKADTLGNMSKYSDGEKAANQAIALNKTGKEAYFELGANLLGNNKPMDAITALNKALNIDSHYADAYNMKGNAYTDISKFDEALDMYNKALSYDSSNALYKINDAMLLYSYFPDKETDVAKKITDILTNSGDDSDPMVMIAKAVAYEAKGDIANANKYCDKALAISPYLIIGDLVKGDILMRGDNPSAHKDEILADFNKVLDTDPNNYNGMTLLGYYYIYLGNDTDKGMSYIQKATTLLPDNYDAYVQLGEAQYYKGAYQDALSSLQKSISIYPTAIAYSFEGNIYYKQNNTNDAISAFKSAVKLGDKDADDYTKLATLLATIGNYSDAITYCKDFLSAYGANETIYEDLAYSYMQTGDYTSALNYINLAIPLCTTKDNLVSDEKGKLAILIKMGASDNQLAQAIIELQNAENS